MARVDYYQIEKDIKTQLEADADLASVSVRIEEEPEFVMGDHVIIYLLGREAPEDMQSISAGTETRYLVTFSIMCFSTGLQLEQLLERRDDLLSQVELALMSNRKFANAQIQSSWLQGGEFENSRNGDEGLFNAGAEIELVVDVTAIQT
tara:strand:+ start:176 stop:622 length:447 start_codon:yes stop_codon:yes gene_type:complete